MFNDIKIAIIATSHAVMGDTGEPTGVWLEELTTPYYQFADAGFEVDVYSIQGGAIPIDPRSLQAKGGNEESVERYLQDETVQEAFAHTPSVETFDVSGYDAVFLPGGHGTMWDYPSSAALKRVVRTAMEGDTVLAAVCHGPAAFVGVEDSNGTPIIKGRRVTAFSDTEEAAVGLTEAVPFLLETRLRELGADVKVAEDFQPHAVRDGLLITGQNPASAGPAAKLLVEALAEERRTQTAAE